jgi:hypothetical protein
MRHTTALSIALLTGVVLIAGCGMAGPSTNKGKLEGTSWDVLGPQVACRKLR